MNWFICNLDFSKYYEELYDVGINQIKYYRYKTTKKTVESNPDYQSDIITDMLIYTEKDGCFDIPIVKSIVNELPFKPNTASFIKLEKYVTMPIHKDDKILRKSHLIIPILPLNSNFTTTKFYDSNNKVIDEAIFDIKPVIINTQEKHGLNNNEYTRIQFNLGFSEGIRDWYELFR